MSNAIRGYGDMIALAGDWEMLAWDSQLVNSLSKLRATNIRYT